MSSLVLIAALLGALVSGALNFFVRRALDARAQRDAERKLAYVLMVRMSRLIAVHKVVRKQMRDKFASIPDDAPLRVSTHFAELLNDPIAKVLTTDQKFKAFPRMIRRMLDDAKESHFSLEQLAKLPRNAIVAMVELQQAHLHVCDAAQLWVDFFEHGERSFITPRGIHSHWLAVDRLIDRAYNARRTLVEYGAATDAEADALLEAQVAHLETLSSTWADHGSQLASIAKRATTGPATPERAEQAPPAA